MSRPQSIPEPQERDPADVRKWMNTLVLWWEDETDDYMYHCRPLTRAERILWRLFQKVPRV